MTAAPHSSAARPLIVRIRNWVGDVVLGLPALQLLENHGYQLKLVARGKWAPSLLAGYDWPVAVQPAGWRSKVARLRALRDQCASQDPGFTQRDNALLLPASFSSALEMRLAGLRAVGYAQEGRSPLLRRTVAHTAQGEHALTSYWRLACEFLQLQLDPPGEIGLLTAAADQAGADAMLAAHGLRPGFVVICPFAGGLFEKQDKTWPAFADFTRELLQLGRDVVACPGPGEEPIISGAHPGVKLLAGVGLGTYGGLLRRAGLVVSNDTGPAHLAAAVGAPVLSVLGPTKPEQWAPWGSRVEVIRHWPHWPSVDVVRQRVQALLG